MTGPTSFTPEVVRTRRVLGALIIVDQVLTYLGPGIDHGAPTIGVSAVFMWPLTWLRSRIAGWAHAVASLVRVERSA